MFGLNLQKWLAILWMLLGFFGFPTEVTFKRGLVLRKCWAPIRNQGLQQSQSLGNLKSTGPAVGCLVGYTTWLTGRVLSPAAVQQLCKPFAHACDTSWAYFFPSLLLHCSQPFLLQVTQSWPFALVPGFWPWDLASDSCSDPWLWFRTTNSCSTGHENPYPGLWQLLPSESQAPLRYSSRWVPKNGGAQNH